MGSLTEQYTKVGQGSWIRKPESDNSAREQQFQALEQRLAQLEQRVKELACAKNSGSSSESASS